VLRSVYGLTGKEVAAALRSFAGLPGVSVENPTLLAEALARAEEGMDFADALHLGAAGCTNLPRRHPVSGRKTRFVGKIRNIA